MLAALIDRAGAVAQRHILCTGGNQELRDGNRGSTRAVDGDFHLAELFPTNFSALISPASVMTAVPC